MTEATVERSMSLEAALQFIARNGRDMSGESCAETASAYLHDARLTPSQRLDAVTVERCADELVAYCKRMNEAGRQASFYDAHRAILALTATLSEKLDVATVEREGDLSYERQYFERGFIAAYAWAATKRASVQLSDDVIDHAWAHRDEGMDADDILPVRALATEPHQHGGKA